MEEFSIKGTDGFVKIMLEQVYTLPEGTCAVGGYEVRATLAISAEGSQVKADLYTSTGEIYAFYQQLKQMMKTGEGTANYQTFEGRLVLELVFAEPGTVKVCGAFLENKATGKRKFGFQTDSSSIQLTLCELKTIADK